MRAKRIKIAELMGACGWEEARCLPDYFHDEAEVMAACDKILKTDFLKEVYVDVLAQLVLRPDKPPKVEGKDGYVGYIELPAIDIYQISNASAYLRAEALFLVIEKHLRT